jgi:hypothetical protein
LEIGSPPSVAPGSTVGLDWGDPMMRRLSDQAARFAPTMDRIIGYIKAHLM